jgi:selenocysteine-specific elongation factor
MIIGTAGHIDHGKTSLVRALTGVDTDRLKEEQRRGITIELGFAYLPRPSGDIIGFVDVPGHERLVHTMLAGATGIDFALLVVAADDGVMPQTREHLAIIDLLGIRRGIVAISKCDLVPPERRAEVSAEIRAALSGIRLAEADIVPVSTVTDEGIAELLSLLDEAAAATRSRSADGRFRLAIDRSFSLRGAGTVVTGTVLSGRVTVGDRVMTSPSGLEARVRSVHAQNTAATMGLAGQRCAIALVGPKIDPESVVRGDVLLDPTLHCPTNRIDLTLKLLPSERKAVSQWLPVKFHHGSAERNARVLALRSGGIAPGDGDYAQIILDRPAAMAAGDRFVLRDSAATRTIGGGTILDLRPPERHRATPARRAELDILAGHDPMAVLRQLLEASRSFIDLVAFFRDRAAASGLLDDAVQALDLMTFGDGDRVVALTQVTWQAYATDVINALDRFHGEKPDLPGLGQERLRLALSPRLPSPTFARALQQLVAEGKVALDRSWVRRPGHEVRLSDEEEKLWSRIAPLLGGEARFRPPRVRDIAKVQRIDEGFIRRLFKLAARRGDVDEVAQDHYFLGSTVIEVADIARALAAADAGGEFSVIAFRDRVQNGRKVAIHILEFFDRQGLTMRRGDIRRINPHKRDLFSRTQTGTAPGAPRDGGETSPVGRPDFKSGEGRETAFGGFDSCLLRHNTTGRR